MQRLFHRTRSGALAALLLALALPACQPPFPLPPAAVPPPVPFEAFADGRNFVLVAPMSYTILNTGQTITIPAGFVTDWASTPRIIWAVLPPFGTYTKASVIHDYLYWMQYCTREQSDKILLAAMIESNVSAVDQRTIYDGVRVGGQEAWDQNARDRRAGLTKYVAPDSSGRIQLAPAETWQHYRATHSQTALDQQALGTPSYCTAAEGARVAAAR